jgi:hypothetical protein
MSILELFLYSENIPISLPAVGKTANCQRREIPAACVDTTAERIIAAHVITGVVFSRGLLYWSLTRFLRKTFLRFQL